MDDKNYTSEDFQPLDANGKPIVVNTRDKRNIAARIIDRDILYANWLAFLDKYFYTTPNQIIKMNELKDKLDSKLTGNDYLTGLKDQKTEALNRFRNANPIEQFILNQRMINFDNAIAKTKKAKEKLSQRIISDRDVFGDYENLKSSKINSTSRERIAKTPKHLIKDFADKISSLMFPYDDEEDKEMAQQIKDDEPEVIPQIQEFDILNNTDQIVDEEEFTKRLSYNFLNDKEIFSGNIDNISDVLDSYTDLRKLYDNSDAVEIQVTTDMDNMTGDPEKAAIGQQAYGALQVSPEYKKQRMNYIEGLKTTQPDLYVALMSDDKTALAQTIALAGCKGLPPKDFIALTGSKFAIMNKEQKQMLTMTTLALAQKMNEDPNFVDTIHNGKLGDLVTNPEIIGMVNAMRTKAFALNNDKSVKDEFMSKFKMGTSLPDSSKFMEAMKNSSKLGREEYTNEFLLFALNSNESMLGRINYTAIGNTVNDMAKIHKNTKTNEIPTGNVFEPVKEKKIGEIPTGNVFEPVKEKQTGEIPTGNVFEPVKEKQTGEIPTGNVFEPRKKEKGQVIPTGDTLKPVVIINPQTSNELPVTYVNGIPLEKEAEKTSEKSLDEEVAEKKNSFEQEASMINKEQNINKNNISSGLSSKRKELTEQTISSAVEKFENKELTKKNILSRLGFEGNELTGQVISRAVEEFKNDGNIYTTDIISLSKIDKTGQVIGLMQKLFNEDEANKAIKKESQIAYLYDANVISANNIQKFVDSDKCKFTDTMKKNVLEDLFKKELAKDKDRTDENKYVSSAAQLYSIEKKFGANELLKKSVKDPEFDKYYDSYSKDRKAQEDVIKANAETLIASKDELYNLEGIDLTNATTKELAKESRKIRKKDVDLAKEVDKFNNVLTDTIARVEDKKKTATELAQEVFNIKKQNEQYNNSLDKGTDKESATKEQKAALKEIQKNNKDFEELVSVKFDKRADAKKEYNSMLEQEQKEKSRPEEELVDVSSPKALFQDLANKYNETEVKEEKQQILKEMRDGAKMDGTSSDEIIDMILNSNDKKAQQPVETYSGGKKV